MATWHQQQRPSRLYHDTLWSVVTDPPNQCTSISLFATEEQAREFLPKAGPHSYILKPATSTKALKGNR